MIIDLPENFCLEGRSGSFARVKNGVLEISGIWDFEKLMIELTFMIKGKTDCYYCRRKIKEGQITIDHLFPRDFGGISITNNLEPACAHCNREKTNMNQYEYQIWRTIGKRKKEYYETIIQRKKKRIRNSNTKSFDLPMQWVEYGRTESIKQIRCEIRKSKNYDKIMKFANKYGRLPRPIVITKNRYLLEGDTAFNVAKEIGFKIIPIVVLENVIYKN